MTAPRRVPVRKGRPNSYVTIDTWSGRQTVDIERLLDSEEGRAYRRDMANVPVYDLPRAGPRGKKGRK